LSPWLLGRLRETHAAGRGLGLGFSALGGAYVIGGVAVLCAVMFTFRKDQVAEGKEVENSKLQGSGK
jgi:hypothetical protein